MKLMDIVKDLTLKDKGTRSLEKEKRNWIFQCTEEMHQKIWKRSLLRPNREFDNDS